MSYDAAANQREQFTLDLTIAGFLRHSDDSHVIIMALPEQVLIKPEEFPGQPPNPVPRNYPFNLSLNNDAKPLPGILVAALEKEEMGCGSAPHPSCPLKPPPVYSFVFTEGLWHQTVSLCLPLARLLLTTSLPDSVLILTRKPWVLFLLLLCG